MRRSLKHLLSLLAMASLMSIGVGCKSKAETKPDDTTALIDETQTQGVGKPVDTDRYEESLAAAQRAVEANDWKQAVAAYKDAIDANPDRWELYMDLAVAQSKVPSFLHAIESIDLAMQLGGSKDWRTWYNLGNIYQNRGLYKESIDAYRVALNYQEKDHVPTLLNLASGYIFLRHYDEARATLEHITTIAPREVRVFHNLALLDHMQEKFPEALRGYDDALALDPDFAQSHYNKGDVLIELKRYNDASEAYMNYIRLEPDGAYITRARNKADWCKRQ